MRDHRHGVFLLSDVVSDLYSLKESLLYFSVNHDLFRFTWMLRFPLCRLTDSWKQTAASCSALYASEGLRVSNMTGLDPLSERGANVVSGSLRCGVERSGLYSPGSRFERKPEIESVAGLSSSCVHTGPKVRMLSKHSLCKYKSLKKSRPAKAFWLWWILPDVVPSPFPSSDFPFHKPHLRVFASTQ